MNEDTKYTVHLFVEYNKEAPLRMIMDADSDFKTELGYDTDYQRITKSYYEGAALSVTKDMAWSSEFQLKWHHNRLKELLEKHKKVILRMDFTAWEKVIKITETELKEIGIDYDNRPKKMNEERQ